MAGKKLAVLPKVKGGKVNLKGDYKGGAWGGKKVGKGPKKSI